MYIIGVTGPSGAGKGVLSEILSEYGFPVIDADKVYHSVITPPSKCLDELANYFGNGIISSDGTLDRARLSNIVFNKDQPEKLEMLNKITHAHVCKRIFAHIDELKLRGEHVCVIDAPLLIEAGLNNKCDLLIAVIADKALRAVRIAKRDSISEDRAYERINAQKSDEFYSSATDYVIYNNGDTVDVKKAIDDILAERKVLLI